MERLSKYDKETSINYNNGEPDAEIYTYDRRLINTLKKKNIKFISNADGSVLCRIPKTWIKISTPRNVSDEARKIFAEKAKRIGRHNG